MMLKLEGRLVDAVELPDDLGEGDVGRTWWIGYVWHIWTGDHYMKALAGKEVPDYQPTLIRKQTPKQTTP